MNVSRILILVVAVIAGGGAFFLSMSGGGDSSSPVSEIVSPKPEVAMSKVLFAKSDIPQGARVEESQMSWVKWPAKDVPEFYITQDNEEYLTALPEMRARQMIRAGEPIYPNNTVAYGDRGLMAAIMTPGMRAVTARLSVEQVSGGFVLPGDRVDIYGTRDQAMDIGDGADNQLANSRIVLSNVRVLAIDQTISADEETSAITGKTVTLEVSPAQVRQFLQARSSETLTLVLRSVFEDVETNTDIEQATPDQVVVIRYGQG